MQVQKLIQGSKAWRQARSREGLCLASQAAAAVNEGKFMPKNQDELLRLKRGEMTIPYTAAMRHGNTHEAEAREWVENEIGAIFEPVSLMREIEDLNYWASLDGATMDLDAAIEIKCPYKGNNSELWAYTAQHKAPPPHYYWQMLHQYLVCPALYYFVVYDAHNKQGLLSTVDFSDELKAEHLKGGWKMFWRRYYSGETPKPDFIERTDAEWVEAASNWKLTKNSLDKAAADEKAARDRLIALAADRSSDGSGVKLTRYTSGGRIDYSKIPEIQQMNLEKYRMPARTQWRVTETD